MASTFAHTHTGINTVAARTPAVKIATESGSVTKFLRDLFEDLREKPLQAAQFAKHDMFREHINAMSISYFALIVLLIVASVPMLAYLVPLLTGEGG
jgi:hypothetical protein